jgi:hypothetical protein
MNPRKIKSILALTILLASLIAPMINTVSADVHEDEWYMKSDGVLTSDSYDFYPYDNDSISFGFSKYGENIWWNESAGIGVGIQYPGYESVDTYDQRLLTSADPFANELVDKRYYLNGWLLEARYTTRSAPFDRRFMAMAMFADLTASGEDWLNGHDIDFSLAPHGGRKCTGWAETEDIQVLYDGPRKMIAKTSTHLRDWEDTNLDGEITYDETWPLINLNITFIFNKVKKEVILIKDIKLVLAGKILESPVDVQFSEREEWDLGPPTEFWSYAQFWHQMNETCYGPEWHMAEGIMREFDTVHLVQQTTDDYEFCLKWPLGDYGLPIVDGSYRLYEWDDDDDVWMWLDPGFDYELDIETGRVDLLFPVIANETEIRTIFKVWKYYESDWEDICEDILTDQLQNLGTWEASGGWGGPGAGVPHLYDIVQIISDDEEWVGCKAYWPTLSDYTSDGWTISLEPLIWINQPDIVPVEPEIPFTIGEWDFMLGKGHPMMFRGVEVVALTNNHDALDDEMPTSNVNQMDRELRYQLDEIFNPWDLEKAVHKPTRTWVEWFTGTGYTTNHRPFAYWPDNEWDQYNDPDGNKVFSERVYNLDTGQLMNRWEGDYDCMVTGDGYGYVYNLPYDDYKIVYHTLPVFEAENIMIYPGGTVEDTLGVTHGVDLGPWSRTFEWNTETDYNWTVSDTLADGMFMEKDFKVFIEETHESGPVPFEITAMYTHPSTGDSLLNVSYAGSWNYWITHSVGVDVNYPTELGTLHVMDYAHEMMYDFTVSYNTETGISYDEDTYFYIDVLEKMGGRYEHTIVGKDAASVDSIGAALVTAAFKNKQIEIGISGIDMEEEGMANDVPWVFSKAGLGIDQTGTYEDYRDELKRVHLKDDWCHTWQITASNMIMIGGTEPNVNLGTYYFNDFLDALADMTGEFSAPYGSPWAGRIAGVTCWNKNSYSSFDDDDIGYAVIGTYHDINGTTGLNIYGHFGRDTYYACRFFHEELIYEFQEFDPCITAVILEIDYTDPDHPTFDIVEVLGTISEHDDWEEIWEARKFLHDNYYDYLYTYPSGLSSAWTILKGDIHDP